MRPAKQVMIDKIIEAIKDFGEDTRKNTEMSTKDKCIQVDVLLDTIRFLDNYDENVKILNEHVNKNKWKEH